MEENRTRFGRIIKERRNFLGLIQEEVTELGGPSDTTQTRIEKGEGATPTLTTRNSYDVPLRWPAGTAARIWAGGDPPPNDDRTPATNRGAHTDFVFPENVVVHLDLVTSLTRSMTKLQNLLDNDTSTPALQTIANEWKTSVSALIRAWIIELLEQNQGGDAEKSALRLIDLMHGEHLALPVDPIAPDADEQRYCRWLAHQPDQLDPETVARFQRRLQSSSNGHYTR